MFGAKLSIMCERERCAKKKLLSSSFLRQQRPLFFLLFLFLLKVLCTNFCPLRPLNVFSFVAKGKGKERHTCCCFFQTGKTIRKKEKGEA